MQNQQNNTYSGFDELLILELMKNYNNAIVEDSIRYKGKSSKILDFGAGVGTLPLIFRDRFKIEPLCIEIDEKNIEFLKNRKFKLRKSLLEAFEPVDLIFSSNVLEHINDDSNILKMFRGKLKDNGKIYLFLPAKMILWTKLDNLVGHYRRYEISNLKNLCKNNGFKIIKIHYSDFLGFFITLIWKFLNFFQTKKFPSRSSLIFYDKYIFPLSRFLDKLGFRYLIGKNIILVAKKMN